MHGLWSDLRWAWRALLRAPALLASWVPARRATRVSPSLALRAE